ncbi:hypothetical protein [Methanohalophilus sp.]|nr:hypothetical protein [Methanohalophilus sp.]
MDFVLEYGVVLESQHGKARFVHKDVEDLHEHKQLACISSHL